MTDTTALTHAAAVEALARAIRETRDRPHATFADEARAALAALAKVAGVDATWLVFTASTLELDAMMHRELELPAKMATLNSAAALLRVLAEAADAG